MLLVALVPAKFKGESMAGFIKAATEIIMKACFNSWLRDARIVPTKSGVYLNHVIEEFLKDIRSHMYWIYSAEDREDMTHENQNFIDDLEMDRLAKEDEEYRLGQKEKMLKNNIIPIRRKGDVGTSDDSI